MELFRKFISEKDGASLIEIEGAFLTYLIVGKQFYISDFYIADAKHNAGRLRDLMSKAFEIAKSFECVEMGCHVPLNIKNLSEVLITRLKFGFKILGVAEGGRSLAMLIPIDEVEKWVR